MTIYRFLGWPRRSLRGDGFRLSLCLTLLALSSCASPKSQPASKDGGESDTTGASPSDARSDGQDAKRADAVLPPICKGDAGPPTKGKGEGCVCDGECRTAHCIDGVCCASACDDKCKACNLPSALGDCTLISAGGFPTDPAECAATSGTTCGQDGKCDGNGGCQLHVADTICDYGSCDGDGLVGVKTCDGNGHCGGSMGQSCAPYSCDPKTNECDSRCTTSAQCALGQKCDTGSCGLKFNAYRCESDGECASGHCADGYCCNVGCNGPCVSCVLPGAIGRCQLVPAGQKSSGCPEETTSSCGNTGYCDGAGACALWPADTTPCATSSCASPTMLNATAVCDGKGSCQEPQLIDCSPFLCVAGACTSTCRSDADCEAGHACVFAVGAPFGTCGKKQNGQPCGDAEECNSGQCVDGVCCESGCEGACRSCSLPGSPGRCVNLPAGAPDPRKTCTDDGSASCGQTGVCDGLGACQIYPVGTKCGSTSCVLGSFTDAPTCNQAGQCVAPPSRSCSPYVCNGNACFNGCTKDTDCVPPNTCINNSCGKGELGAVCSSANDCNSGFCAQGVCCNSSCTEACYACNLAGTTGLCTTVSNGSPDPQEKCLVTDKTTCGTTGACWWGTCAYAASGTTCKPAACASTSSVTPASTCDGSGSCVTPSIASCGTFTCRNNACLATCATDGDCVTPTTCTNNSCGLKSNGAACTANSQCGSGFCTEGVCCNSACSEAISGALCMSCKVTGKVGTCTPVPDGQADPRQRCVATTPGSGDCTNDGTCNGKGACRPWSTNTGCRLATCVGSTYTPAANCDGGGRCPIVASFSCSPYLCNKNSPSCLATCTTSNDCVSGVTCLQTNNRCGTTLQNGQPCKANSDCASNNCVGGVLCCPADNCAIGGQCIPKGTLNPSNACQVCTPATNATGWSPRGANVECRTAAGACDVAEVCDATGAPCPADGFLPATTECRAAAGVCDVAEYCSGTSAACPANGLQPSTKECRAANGVCDAAERCTGSSVSCPADGFQPSTTECRAATGVCDAAERCTGSSATCPADALQPSTKECRAANGVCDTAELCTGLSAACPADAFKADTVECRAANGVCDVAELCTGLSTACPADALKADTVECRASAGACDVAERCTGLSAACPANAFQPDTTECRASAGVCDVAERCTGASATCPADTFQQNTVECRASAGACDVAENCTGDSATCPGDGLAQAGTQCRAAAGACDVVENCTGNSATCPGDAFVEAGMECRAAAGDCDVAANCTGNSATCPANTFQGPEVQCRSSDGVCDVAEHCTGATASCPDNAFAGVAVECRASAGDCDVAENCTGASAGCPADQSAPDGTTCDGGGGLCTGGVCGPVP